MPTDLDTRIRELVFDVVDLTPPAPELPLLEPTRPHARRLHRHAAVVAMVAALLVALLVGTVALTRDGRGHGRARGRRTWSGRRSRSRRFPRASPRPAWAVTTCSTCASATT